MLSFNRALLNCFQTTEFEQATFIVNNLIIILRLPAKENREVKPRTSRLLLRNFYAAVRTNFCLIKTNQKDRRHTNCSHCAYLAGNQLRNINCIDEYIMRFEIKGRLNRIHGIK